MPAAAPGGRFLADPQRALLTPSASPSVGPPDRPRTKRPRLRSTPSSSISATPSTLNESTSSADVNSARRASTLRVLNTWAQLAERHNKRLDEDDIIDLHSFVIIKDRGAIKSASTDYQIGHFTQFDGDQDFPDGDQEDSEQDDDDDEVNALPPSEATTDDDAPISKTELLRGVPPLSATTDAEDLREFLEAEKKRKQLAGDEEDEEELSPEQMSALRKVLEEHSQKREAAMANRAQDVTAAAAREVDTTPTGPSTCAPPSDDESEDELARWTHDESTAVYPVGQDESEQVEREIIELPESDSDEEFEAILTHPPRFSRVPALPAPQPKESQRLLHSPPDSERGRSKSRARHSEVNSPNVALKENRPRSPLALQKPEIILTHKRKPYISKETSNKDGDLDQEVVGRLSAVHKGKSKETPPPIEDGQCEKTPKSVVSRGQSRKRKRIVSSSTNGGPLSQSPELKSTLRSRRKSTSQSPITSPQDGPKLAKNMSTPVRLEPPVAGPSRLLPSSSTSKTPTALSGPTHRAQEPSPAQAILNKPLLSDPPAPVSHSYSRRDPSHPPAILPFSNQGTPGLSLPIYPPPPMDPVQTQQAHYLLAQAMHQLSYLISATMPSHAAYASNPGGPWHHPPPPPHTGYSTPIHHSSYLHDSRHYHTPSSSTPRSGLPPSSPVESSVSPEVEEQYVRSQGRSKSRGRRVSFNLDSEGIIGSREHRNSELHNGKKKRKPTLDVKREKGEGRVTEETNDPSRLREKDRDSPPPEREVARGRTPGPPGRKRTGVPRGRSLGGGKS